MFLLDISFRQGPGRSQVLKLIIYPFTVVHDGLFHDFFYDLIYDFMIFMIYVVYDKVNSTRKKCQ